MVGRSSIGIIPPGPGLGLDAPISRFCRLNRLDAPCVLAFSNERWRMLYHAVNPVQRFNCWRWPLGCPSSGRVLATCPNDVVLGLFGAGPDMHTLPIAPDRHRGTCRLLPERFVMKPRPVRCQRVDRFPSFHGVDQHFRVMTGSHAATVPGAIAVHADRFRMSFLENGVLIRRGGPVFGRRCGAEDERD